jgi:hypothetical protein
LLAVGASCSDEESVDPTTTAPPSATSAPAATTAPASTIAPVATTAQARTTVPGGTHPELFAGTVEAFYGAPDPLPAGEPGKLLRYQPSATTVPYEPDASLFVLETTDVNLWMFSDPLALLPGEELVADPQVGGSVDELVAWLVGHPKLDTSVPEPASIGGLPGFQVDVAIAPGTGTCCYLFASPDHNWYDGPGPGETRVILLLVTPDGGTVVISLSPGESLVGDRAAFHRRATSLMDSLDLDFTHAATGPDRAAARMFRPAFSYAIPEPDGDAPALWRIMYLSESIQGEPIAVTGTVVVPAKPAPPGGRPILSAAHGTEGIADRCAPSITEPGRALVEHPSFAEAGYIIAYTDYEGLGTPGRHPYIVGVSEGRGVLDAAKAARQLPGAEAGDQLAIIGFSQGGHAALFAAELAAEWAPQFGLVGTVAAGVPADLTNAGAAETAIDTAFLVIAGYDAAYPDMELTWVLTPAGEAELDAVDRCDSDLNFEGRDPAELLKPPGSSPEFEALLRANNPGQVRVDSPILLIQGINGDFPGIQALHDQMCQRGQDVELRFVEGGHLAAGDTAFDGTGFDWIQQRLNGDQLVTTCG